MIHLVMSVFAAHFATADVVYKDPATAASGRYHIEAASDDRGILVFIHGSGGAASYKSLLPTLLKITKPYKQAVLMAQVPNDRDTWAEAEHGPQFNHAAYLKGLLNTVVKEKHPHLSGKPVTFVGLSAGSTFLSGDFLPIFVNEFPEGSAILLCGGGPPVGRVASVHDRVRTRFAIEVVITTSDFLYDQTMDAVRYWRNRRVATNLTRIPKGGHCGFDLEKQLQAALNRLQT